jgi:hypothetical protein
MSEYSYTLIVKGSELEAGRAVKERLGGLAGVSIESATAWDHPYECVFSIAAGQDLTNTLNTWFTEDSYTGPFPAGSLLGWNTH